MGTHGGSPINKASLEACSRESRHFSDERFKKRSIMVNGIPFSMTLPKNSREKAMVAMKEIQDSAEQNGLTEMTLDEINAEITEARKSVGERSRQ